MAKFIYSSLFDWLVGNINNVLCTSQVSETINSFIGVLDIYGFEHFEQNSFEQFCINYANEKLQQEFNHHVFKLEQEEYVKEEIEWSFIEFSDNQPCIDLIENKLGILSLLDEESRLPAGSDESWTTKLYQTFNKPPSNTVFGKPRFGQNKFIISHYAVDVTYEVDGFIEKNKDTISESQLEVLKATTNPTLATIFEFSEAENKTNITEQAGTIQRKTINRKPTLGSIFKRSLVELMETINSTNVHYIRCIKPNTEKEAWKFDNLMVLSQLRACGVLETIKISCAGFPSRWAFEEFIQRYYLLAPTDQWGRVTADMEMSLEDMVAFCDLILSEKIDSKDKYQIGKTKIFFKAGVLAYLEKIRSDKVTELAVLIQKHIRAKYYRSLYLQAMLSIKNCQSLIRGVQSRQRVDFEMKTDAATLLQTLHRSTRVRSQVFETLKNILEVQTAIRRVLVSNFIQREFESRSAIMIQSKIRANSPKHRYQTLKTGTILIQALVRRKQSQEKLKQLKIQAESAASLKNSAAGIQKELIGFIEELISNIKENDAKTTEYKSLLKHTSLPVVTGTNERTAAYISTKNQVEEDKVTIRTILTKYETLKDLCRKELKSLESLEKGVNDEKFASSLQSSLELIKRDISDLRINAIEKDNERTSTSSELKDGTDCTDNAVVQILTKRQGDLINDLVNVVFLEFQIPQRGRTKDCEHFYPVKLLISIVNLMNKFGLRKSSHSILKQTVQDLIGKISSMDAKKCVTFGLYWIISLHKLSSLPQEPAVLNKLQDKFYKTWLKQCFNQMKTVDSILILFDTISEFTLFFQGTTELLTNIITALLQHINAKWFNDLLIKQNTLSWTHGLEKDSEIKKVLDWCNSHKIRNSTEYLRNVNQACKLLQLRISNISDFQLVCEFCYDLSSLQMHALLTKYRPTQFEKPIPVDVLNHLSNTARRERTTMKRELTLDAGTETYSVENLFQGHPIEASDEHDDINQLINQLPSDKDFPVIKELGSLLA